MPPLIYFIFPVGTKDKVIFSKEVTQHLAALEQRITPLTCDQSRKDIFKNYEEIRSNKPDIVILGSSIDEEPFTTYSHLILRDRPRLRSSDPAKPLIYHYENKFAVDTGKLESNVDEYFPTLGELIQALLIRNRIYS